MLGGFLPMRLMLILALLPALCAADEKLFEYDRKIPIARQQIGMLQRWDVPVFDYSYANLTGGRIAAYLVPSTQKGKSAAVLFVHWYEPESKDSNRTQFLDQAVELAKAGATSLLIETMWSEPTWFSKRNSADDFYNSVQQVKEIRRALDFLLADPRIDRKRVAYVGHDFGMMYGAVLSGIDHRPQVWALQAGTTSFSDWFLLGSKLQGEERQKFIEQLAPLDPVKYIGKAGGPVLMQFAKSDRFVPEQKAKDFFAAAKEPKKILWYDAQHGLNAEAIKERQAWLKEQLKLK
jgi:dienelactone hydrolase